MADACGGLHAAHELRNAEGSLLNLVHRDVSPQNILVSARGMAKLIDFGIAKVRDRMADDVTTGPLKGKARYMSPEQARGEVVDRRADVWAVGAVLYHLLSGRAPYEGANDVETLVRLRSAEAPEALVSEVHSAVASVVMRALGPKRDDRFASATELQQAIEGAMVEARLETTDAKVASFLAARGPDGAITTKRKAMIARGLRNLSELQSPDPEETPVRSLPVPSPSSGTGNAVSPAAVEIEVEVDPPPQAAPRRPWMFAAAVACVLAGSAGVAVFARSHARKAATTAAPPPPAFAASAAAMSDSRGPPESRPVSGGELRVPTVDVTQLPLAAGVPSATASVVAPPQARPPPVPRPPKPPVRVRIDDGF
jgi:serine/threonine-protein kinase